MNLNSYTMTSQKSVLWIGGTVCFVLLGYSLATLLIMTLIGGPPETIEQTFSLLHDKKLSGLLRLDILTVFVMPLYYLLFYSLYISLKDSDKSISMISMILAFAGVTLFLATPSVFSYLHLSDRFATDRKSV